LKIEYTGISNKVFKGLINEVQKLNNQKRNFLIDEL